MEFKEEKVEVKTESRTLVIIGGQEVGEVTYQPRSWEDSWFHAVLNISNGLGERSSSLCTELVQGHGETREAAVAEALNKGLKKYSCVVAEIEKLQREIRQENELDELLEC